MIANYHAHTIRCNHATGTEAEYVEAAIKRGLKIFGFSDHSPQFFPGDYYTFMRMRPQQLDDYCETIRTLQTQYRERIEIPLGLEVEYYPALWGELISKLQDAGIEYLILGQHWLGNEIGEPGSASTCTDEATLSRYCRQVIAAMETRKFTYVAHPDLMNFIGNPKVYRPHIREFCRAAREMAIPLEINLLGMANNRHYPNEQFWEVAAEEGCKAVLGIDAHAPAHILNTEPEQNARKLVQRLGLELLETVKLKHI